MIRFFFIQQTRKKKNEKKMKRYNSVSVSRETLMIHIYRINVKVHGYEYIYMSGDFELRNYVMVLKITFSLKS